MEEEVDPSMKREKHKENSVKNVGCTDHFLDNPIPKLIKKEAEAGDAAKPHSFQDSDFHKKIVMIKQKSLLGLNSIMKVDGTLMMLEPCLLGEPLALNFVMSMAEILAVELRQKECTEAVMPLDLSLHAKAMGRSQLSYKGCSCLPTIRENLRKFLCAIPVFKFQP
ncbi:hypothetical protein HKD37_09G025119 [Glycine soja]